MKLLTEHIELSEMMVHRDLHVGILINGKIGHKAWDLSCRGIFDSIHEQILMNINFEIRRHFHSREFMDDIIK